MARVLLVDDEPNIRRMLGSLLEAEGYAVKPAADAEEALAALEGWEADVALLDLALPGIDGLDLLVSIRGRWPALPVVMISGRATLGDAVRATKLGAFHFIEKPLAPEAVLLTVAGAVELRRARELSRQLTEQLGAGTELIGSSLAMRDVRGLIAQMAATDARVLITGESGTGKELAATALHAGSMRSAKPFVRVNSAAIPRELVESEMFGHERGAFTGATDTRRGRFELADGGTLFLDEIADLSADAQAKLLRAIESGLIERIGGERPIPVDVRVIAATNRDLAAEMAAGRFREDLYYRINVLPLHMPPLRERADDVPELTEHLFARLRERAGLAPPRFEPDALGRLREYHWPGNVRELANVCERLAILYPERTVGAAHVDAVLPPRGEREADEPAAGLNERLESLERELIADALAAADHNIAEAARRLHTDRANLYRRMRRLGINR
jgi:two-component system nitrogen regulation response regulator NtrX